MPAGIVRRQEILSGTLLGALHVENDRLGAALAQHPAAAVAIQGEFGVHQVAMRSDEIPGRCLRRLLVAAERDDEIACRHEALGLEAQKRRSQQRDFLLDVRSTAPVEKAVLFGEMIRIPLPVAAFRSDHVHVGHEGDRPSAAAVAPVSNDQGCGLAQRQDMDVRGGKTAGLEALREIFRHHRHLPLADGAFDSDDVREYLTRLGAHRVRRSGGGAGGNGGNGAHKVPALKQIFSCCNSVLFIISPSIFQPYLRE